MISEALELRVGDSALPALAPGSSLHLTIPPADGLIKCESEVISWIERLGDDAAIVKLYSFGNQPSVVRALRAGSRVRREYEALAAIQGAGGLATEPLFWALDPSRQRGQVEVLATRLIPDVGSVRNAVSDRHELLDELDWASLLGSIHRMHEAGICHGGLSPKNVLLDAKGRIYLCDLAKSIRYPHSIRGTRMASYDIAHLLRGFSDLVGWSRTQRVWLATDEAPEFQQHVLAKAQVQDSRSGLQRRRLRGEFRLRRLLAGRLRRSS
jgi:serine/threonine-protein kinase RIO1